MQQQQIRVRDREKEKEEDYSTIRISRKTLNELGRHAVFRDNWDMALQRVLKKVEDSEDKLQPSSGGSF
jgi:hypothetical protein